MNVSFTLQAFTLKTLEIWMPFHQIRYQLLSQADFSNPNSNQEAP